MLFFLCRSVVNLDYHFRPIWVTNIVSCVFPSGQLSVVFLSLLQAWELAVDPRISIGKKMSTPKNKMIRSNSNVIVLYEVKNWQNWKMQGCFMQFLRLIFVKKLQGALPPDPHGGVAPWTPTGGVAPWTPTGGLLRPQPPTFQLTFPFLIPIPVIGCRDLWRLAMEKLQCYCIDPVDLILSSTCLHLNSDAFWPFVLQTFLYFLVLWGRDF